MVPPLATADESSTKTHSNRWSIVSELDKIEITGPLCLILFFAVGEIHWDPNTFSLDLSVLKKDKMICRITNYLKIGAESLLHLLSAISVYLILISIKTVVTCWKHTHCNIESFILKDSSWMQNCFVTLEDYTKLDER